MAREIKQKDTFDDCLLALLRKAIDHESETVVREVVEFIAYCGRGYLLEDYPELLKNNGGKE